MTTKKQQRQVELDRNLLQSLQNSGNEWTSRGQLTRLIGMSFNKAHRSSLSRLELEGLVEIRQGKNRMGGSRLEYRAKYKG